MNILSTSEECLLVDRVRDNRDIKLNPTLLKLCDQFCAITKSGVSINITQTARRNELKIAVKVD